MKGVINEDCIKVHTPDQFKIKARFCRNRNQLSSLSLIINYPIHAMVIIIQIKDGKENQGNHYLT